VVRGASLIRVDVQLFRDGGLGNGSYLVEVSAGRAVLIDPDRRVRRYLEAAKARGFEIAGVLDTHLHADFVSGAQDIRAETGAELYEPAEAGVSFPHTPVAPGERIDLEDVAVEVLATPGHSPEHVSYVFRREGETAPVLFSGGALIVGGAARSDLAGPELRGQEAVGVRLCRPRLRPEDQLTRRPELQARCGDVPQVGRAGDLGELLLAGHGVAQVLDEEGCRDRDECAAERTDEHDEHRALADPHPGCRRIDDRDLAFRADGALGGQPRELVGDLVGDR
jgi:hypothetical protein